MAASDLHGARTAIDAGQASLGLELGSTRIKACLVDRDGAVLAAGQHAWENTLVDGVWTYGMESVWSGVQECMAALFADCEARLGVRPAVLAGLGVSAMMHGYLALGDDGEPLVPFRTWRNTSTGPAAQELTRVLGVNIPLRWSVAHLYQAVLDDEPHVMHLRGLTTLAGYVHRRLTGRNVLGVGDASGMFPIDLTTGTYGTARLEAFDALVGTRCPLPLGELLPPVLQAGVTAGHLTREGALLLDPSGGLQPGAAACPPEGDAGTGMVATNAVAPRSGNVSVGTSIFAMVVLERPLEHVHPEIDIVTTPTGEPVAMVHCNNGAAELAAWADTYRRFAELLGLEVDRDEVFAALLAEALQGESDGGGVLAYGYVAGEPIADVAHGGPLVLRAPDSSLTLANLMRAQVLSVFATLSLGMRTLREEGVAIDGLVAHGGIFRTPGAPQRLLAASLDVPIAVQATAGEGGAWGMALLAAYLEASESLSLEAFLADRVFADATGGAVAPEPDDRSGFERYLARYVAGLPVERAAGAALRAED